MKNRLIAILVVLVSGLCHAQDFDHSSHTKSVETFVQGFNTQDYRLMKKPLALVGKLLVGKKRLKNAFGSFYTKYGALKIDTIIYTSVYNGTAELKSKSHPHKRTFLTFNFNESGKLQGFGFGYPTFVFKQEEENTERITESKRLEIIDSLVSKAASQSVPRNFNGTVLVTKSEHILYKKHVGYSNFESQQLINDSTLFLLASCSKQFTAVAIMMLQKKSLLNITDKVKQHLTGFPYANITIEHLLTHTSGLPSYFPLIEKYGDKSDFISNVDVLNLLIEHKRDLRFEPNSRFEYCNTGYVLLSLIIESASGQSYSEFLESNIFEPLGMKHTKVYNRRKENNTISNYAFGYVYSGKQEKYLLPDSTENMRYVSYMDGITGDDGVSSCTQDLQKWIRGLRKNKILGDASMRQITTSHTLVDGTKTNYGYGFITREGKGIENLYYHTGSWPGYSAILVELVDRQESVIILCNTHYDNLTFLADEIIYTLRKCNGVTE